MGSRNVLKYCDWLYKAVVIDANGRILPCCYMLIVADGGRGTLEKWIQDADVGELYNSTEYQDMRINKNRLTGRAYCGIKGGLIFDTSHIKRDFQYWSICHDLDSEVIEALCDWKAELQSKECNWRRRGPWNLQENVLYLGSVTWNYR